MHLLYNLWFKIGFISAFLILATGILIFALKYEHGNKTEQPRIIYIEKATSTESIQKQLDVPKIIAKWHGAIARIDCYFVSKDEKLYVQTGSGFLKNSSSTELRVLTNRHVLVDEENGYSAPRLCDVRLPGSDESFIANSEALEDFESDLWFATSTLDWGYINISYPSKGFTKAISMNLDFCEDQQDLGMPIVILGYPEVGSKNDITVTQGIISGYEEGYYITDAKIGHGNSGGVAIGVDLKTNNSCLLGIPTYVEIGEIISLGRILDIRKIAEDW